MNLRPFHNSWLVYSRWNLFLDTEQAILSCFFPPQHVDRQLSSTVHRRRRELFFAFSGVSAHALLRSDARYSLNSTKAVSS